MAIRAVFTNHIYPEMPAASGAYPYSGKKINTILIPSTMTINLNALGGIEFYTINNNYPTLGGWVYYTASDLTDGVSPYSVIGFTVTNDRVLSGYEKTWPIFEVGGAGFTYQELGADVLYATKTITAIIDRTVTPNTVTILREGVYAMKKSMPASGSYAGASTIAFSASSGRERTSLMFSNFYFVDDTQDDTQCGPILNLAVAPQYLLQADEPTTWVGTNGDSILNITRSLMSNAAQLTTPVFSSATIPTKLRTKLNNIQVDTYGKVYGLDIILTAARRDATTVGKLTLESGTVISNQPAIKFIGTGMTYEMRSPVNERSPDGTRWNRDKLIDLVVGIEPTT